MGQIVAYSCEGDHLLCPGTVNSCFCQGEGDGVTFNCKPCFQPGGCCTTVCLRPSSPYSPPPYCVTYPDSTKCSPGQNCYMGLPCICSFTEPQPPSCKEGAPCGACGKWKCGPNGEYLECQDQKECYPSSTVPCSAPVCPGGQVCPGEKHCKTDCTWGKCVPKDKECSLGEKRKCCDPKCQTFSGSFGSQRMYAIGESNNFLCSEEGTCNSNWRCSHPEEVNGTPTPTSTRTITPSPEWREIPPFLSLTKIIISSLKEIVSWLKIK